MLDVQRGQMEAQMEGGGSNDKVLESDRDALGCLLTLNASGKLGDLDRDRMDDETLECSLCEHAPPFPIGGCSGAVDAMGQLDNSYGGYGDVYIAVGSSCLAEDLFDGLSTPFARDEDAGI